MASKKKRKIGVILHLAGFIALLIYIIFTVLAINTTKFFSVKNNATSNDITPSYSGEIPASISLTNPLYSPTLFSTNVISPSSAFTFTISPFPTISTINPNINNTVKIKIKNLTSSSSNELQKLDEYQTITNSYVTNKMMIFSYMPSDSDAKGVADDLAVELKEFSKYGVTPIVIVEPVNSANSFDPNNYLNGDYDNAYNTYFNRLKELGISDDQLGIFTPFPEINIPEWNGKNYSSDLYTKVINKYLTKLRSIFPHAKTSLLLDSATVDSWDNSNYATDYKSLLPYVKNINKGLVDYFCLQGFVWIPEKGSSDTASLDPNKFLSTNEAKEAADGLGIKSIWFNTGTPLSMYTNDPSKTATLTADQRQSILTKIADQTNTLKNSGYNVWINLFDENKSTSDEAVDWSYWHSPTDTTAHVSVFKNFFAHINKYNIPLSLYDHK